jgi:adenylate cyclase
MSAEACAGFLNHHLSLLTGCIEAERGVVDKFIGDAVMAVWIDAEPDAGAQAAARAALTMRAALHADNAVHQPPVRVRVGLHTGEVVIGSLGSPTRLNFTVVGEAVNVAQRIEALGKLVAADAEVAILASAHTAALLADGFRLRPVGPHRLPGHDEPIQVVAIDGMIASGAGRGSWPVAATGASR